MFHTVLIANRGEIACRIIRSCRRLGIRSVAVYSTADANALHAREADEAHCIGAAPARDSYLDGAKIIAVAQRCGAQAVHPGYGFLSENAQFATNCAEAGLVFVGPSPAAMQAMGLKAQAKQLMAQAGVPLLPGYQDADQSSATLRAAARQVGYPLLIKASAGGGGKGMRKVQDEAGFEEALAGCQREAQASFDNNAVILERWLEPARHIEVQVFGDTHGTVIALHERDCSAQRRHQKVIEEAPSPGLDAEQRAAMARAACNAACAVGYVGAGTVEFIVDSQQRFYFMEMNTRLQVEHPVTEMITGLDLVEWQLRIAAGEPLPLTQEQVPLHGHAIEARVYAEEPRKHFLPSIGQLVHFHPPRTGAQVRIDSGVTQGDEITPYYDPLLAKLIVWGEDRVAALQRLQCALRDFQIAGVGHNLGFLLKLSEHAAFREAKVDTRFIERELTTLLADENAAPTTETLIAAAAWTLHQEARQSSVNAARDNDPHSPWALTHGWRLNGEQQRELRFVHGEQTHTVSVIYRCDDRYRINDRVVQIVSAGDSALDLLIDDERLHADVVEVSDRRHVFTAQGEQVLRVIDALHHERQEAITQGGLTAPMSGTVIQLAVAAQSPVAAGAPLLVMEAMKMEHTLYAPAAGMVREWLCREGESVREGAPLLEFEVQS